VPTALDRIVSRGLAKSPEDRYASAAEMHADLEALEASLGRGPCQPPDRARHLAAWLRALLPGEADREPVLDRKPSTDRFAVETPREPTTMDLALVAEAELEGDAMLREQQGRQRVVSLVVALLVVATIAFVVVHLR
jgi:hypothetical protein